MVLIINSSQGPLIIFLALFISLIKYIHTYFFKLLTIDGTCKNLLNHSSVISHSSTFNIRYLKFYFVGYDDEGVSSVEQNKKVLGSRPPRCVNKCVSCRPCEATLVIPSHQKLIDYRVQSHWEDNYYLLSWKCKCGDKLYQP
ncbi:putative EPIDERMAL PATTERNING FACTOR-like protein [Helianthus annuus]|nr:putative EPIDERMAL PATTERNING FACTOR-like protein [Helianthus annuus]